MEHEGILLRMGNPLLDISAAVDREFLDKYDLKSNNAILAEEKHLPMYEEMGSKYNVEYIAGGATQNSIRVAQWMLQIPGATGYIGSIGKDKFGEEVKKNARQAGVNWKRPNTTTLLDFSSRSPRSLSYLLLSMQLLKTRYMDYVFGTETEARTFSKVHGWETESVEEIAIKISQLPKASGTHKRITVITQGADPVVVAENGKVKLLPIILLPREKLVDTNGEGDAFVGGFLLQLVLEKPIEDCVRAGCHAANLIIQRSGCTYPEKPDFE